MTSGQQTVHSMTYELIVQKKKKTVLFSMVNKVQTAFSKEAISAVRTFISNFQEKYTHLIALIL